MGIGCEFFVPPKLGKHVHETKKISCVKKKKQGLETLTEKIIWIPLHIQSIRKSQVGFCTI
jgi:hypothetical protein